MIRIGSAVDIDNPAHKGSSTRDFNGIYLIISVLVYFVHRWETKNASILICFVSEYVNATLLQ